MGLGMADIPSVVDDLYATLLAEGFEVVEERRGGMGAVLVRLRGRVPGSITHPAADVQISADRGQWTVALRFNGMSRFIDPRVWAAYLDAAPIDEPDVGQQAGFVATRLVDAAEAVHADPGLEAELVRMGEEYMRRQLGLSAGEDLGS